LRSPSDAELLSLWETGRAMDALHRAVAVVCATHPERSTDEVLDWPLGRRDRALLGVHAARVGPSLDVVLTCPACEAQLEASLPVEVLLAEPPPRDPFTVRHAGRELRARCATTRDLAAVAHLTSADHARRALAERLLLDPVPLDDALLAALAEGAREADPLAEIRLEPVCAGCGAPFEAQIEVVDHVWAGITREVQALLRDVHELARAYHWSEAAILGLSPARRDAYLQMVRA